MNVPVSVNALKALKAIKNSTQLLSLIEKISAIDEQISGKIKNLAASVDANYINNKASEIYQLVLSLPMVIRPIDIREFFREVEILDKELLVLFEDVDGSSHFHEIIDAIDELAESINKFVQGLQPQVGSELIFIARKLALSLKNFLSFLEFLIENGDDDTPKEGEDEFLLFLQTTYDLDDFIARLIAISQIYAELAQILGVSSPAMRIAKIESGSLYTRLIGDTRVISLLVELLKGAISFIHRNYTNEGKVNSISSQVDAFDKILELNKKLEAMGVNVKENKEQIAKGVHSISHNLTNLLAGQTNVVVDENIFSLKDVFASLSLNNDSTRRLTFNANSRVDPTLDPNTDEINKER